MGIHLPTDRGKRGPSRGNHPSHSLKKKENRFVRITLPTDRGKRGPSRGSLLFDGPKKGELICGIPPPDGPRKGENRFVGFLNQRGCQELD